MRAATLGFLVSFAPMLTSVAEAASAMNHLKVPKGFSYANDRPVHLRVQVFDHRGMSAANRLIEVFEPDGGQRIVSGMTDDYGVFEGSITLPNHLDQVFLRANVLGIDNEALVAVQDQLVDHVLL
jgi:hypothetical protein